MHDVSFDLVFHPRLPLLALHLPLFVRCPQTPTQPCIHCLVCYISQPVQHQAEQHQQQQHQQQQRQSQGRQAGHDDSRGREAGGARTEGGSGRSQANDSSRRRDHSRDRPSGDSRRRQDRSSERNTTREGVDTRDRDPHSGLDKPRSHRSERAPHGEEEHSSLPGMRGGFRDESSNQSSGRDSARRAEAEEARPAEFDLRQRLDAAKRAKRAQDGESSGGRHRCGRRRPPARQRDEMRAKPGQPGVADSGKHSRMARCVCRSVSREWDAKPKTGHWGLW